MLDSKSGRKVAELPIGKRVDGVEFDPAQQLVWGANGEARVIHEDDPTATTWSRTSRRS